jgi:hypothetical protein
MALHDYLAVMRMKPSALLFAIATILCSCGTRNSAATAPVQNKLTAKVFTLADSVDAQTCEGIPQGTDHWIEYLFTDDSTFLQIEYSCCNPTADFHRKGHYRMQEDELLLRFEPQEVIYSISEDYDSLLQDYRYLISVQRRNIRTYRDTLDVRECNSTPYLISRSGPWSGDPIVVSGDHLQDRIDTLQKHLVWDQLMIQGSQKR